MVVVWYPQRHEEPRCSIAFREGPSRPAAARGAGGSRGSVADRGRPAVWGGARHGDPLDGVVGAAGGEGVPGSPPRPTAAAAPGSCSGSPDRATDREPLPGTGAVALRA